MTWKDGAEMQELVDMMTLEPGIHHGILESTYRADPAVAHSDLRQFMRPKTMHGRELLIGSACHACLLQPELAAATYATAPEEWKLNRKYDGRWPMREFEAETGKIGIKPSERELIRGMVAAVRSSTAAMRILDSPGNNELAAVAGLEQGQGEVLSKVLIDIEREDGIWDLKTTSALDSQWWSECIIGFGYDSAAAYYQDVYQAATGTEVPFRGWIVVSKPMLECWVIDALDYHFASGRRWYQDALRTYTRYLPRQGAVHERERRIREQVSEGRRPEGQEGPADDQRGRDGGHGTRRRCRPQAAHLLRGS